MLHRLLLLNPFISYLSPPLTLPSAPSVLSLPPALPSQGHLGAQGPDGPTGLPGRQGRPGEKVCHTCQQSGPPLVLPLSPFCEGGIIRGTCRLNIPYSGKLSREKTSRISQFCSYTSKFSPRNLGHGVFWHSKNEQSAKVFSAKIVFSPNHESFSLESLPLYHTIV